VEEMSTASSKQQLTQSAFEEYKKAKVSKLNISNITEPSHTEDEIMSKLEREDSVAPPPPPPPESATQDYNIKYGNGANSYSNNNIADDESVEAQHVVYTFAEEGKSSKKGRNKWLCLIFTTVALIAIIIGLGVVYGKQRSQRAIDSNFAEANEGVDTTTDVVDTEADNGKDNDKQKDDKNKDKEDKNKDEDSTPDDTVEDTTDTTEDTTDTTEDTTEETEATEVPSSEGTTEGTTEGTSAGSSSSTSAGTSITSSVGTFDTSSGSSFDRVSCFRNPVGRLVCREFVGSTDAPTNAGTVAPSNADSSVGTFLNSRGSAFAVVSCVRNPNIRNPNFNLECTEFTGEFAGRPGAGAAAAEESGTEFLAEVVEETEAIVDNAEGTPVVEESAPAVEEAAPVVAESAPAVEESAPVEFEEAAAPATEEGVGVAEDTETVLEDVPDATEEIETEDIPESGRGNGRPGNGRGNGRGQGRGN